ncbi:HNH endonuclease [Patescibacteria group bacterium]|nr:HNH endonuclease [Patescibacteria group bacterium]
MPTGVYKRKIKLGKRTAFGTYRPKCLFPGCNNLARKTHRRKSGGWYCDKLCQLHHRKKYDMRLGGADKPRELRGFSEKPCEECGWHKAKCDLHRIVSGSDGGKYKKGNVQVLCPNCHRLKHPERYSLKKGSL